MTPSPATPRPSTAPHTDISKAADDATTPTRATFSPSITGQQPLPSSPFPQATQTSGATDGSPSDVSPQSSRYQRRDSMDIDMDDSDGEPAGADDGAASDDDSVGADGSRSNKKKKSQRFYCTDYPPCNLSFTRSEHLARHIRFALSTYSNPTRRALTVGRKHTGERPFQCHCSRRFSRLDNLRQHAQTVHVNEDIPIDSLAATGSRFQRQMRTDRVRQAGNRARASTGGSAGGPPRGHSKSLSTSSINSISSVGSNYSTTTDARRRPPPLVMADPRSRPVDPYRTNHDATFQYRPPSPSEFSTPTSATFSTGQSSPRWASGMASPTTSHSRSQSMYTTGTRTPGRRQSVPSAANPFQASPAHVAGRPVFGGAGPMNSSNSGAFSPANSSLVTSPTMSTASGWSGRRESTSSATEEAWRRRTWHSDSRSYNQNHHPSQLSNVANQSSMGPNPLPPIANPSNTQSTLQLPGIESFDQPSSHGPLTPPRRHPSPMMVDSQPRPPILQATHREEERRNLNVYDASLQRGLTRLDISPNTPPRDNAGSWASEMNKAVQAQAENVRVNVPVLRFDGQLAPPTSYPNSGGPVETGRSLHQPTMSAPSVTTSRENKRRGWYNGPVTAHRDEGQRPSQGPRAAHVNRMVHPNFTGFSGFPAREQQPPSQPQPQQHQQPQPQPQQQQQQERQVNGGDPLRRLEALVAVATSEGSTATAY